MHPNGQDDKTTPKVLILTIGKPLLTFWNLNKVQEVKIDQVYFWTYLYRFKLYYKLY